MEPPKKFLWSRVELDMGSAIYMPSQKLKWGEE
jgi:hypothetical protein